MSGIFGASQLFFSGTSEFYEFNITNSLRFDDGNSAFLQRTLNGNRQTYSISFWYKRSSITSTTQRILHCLNPSPSATYRGAIHIDTSQRLYFEVGGSSRFRLISNKIFRDVSAWYNIVLVVDITNTTTADKLRMYVNGTRITGDATTGTGGGFNTETQPTNETYSAGLLNSNNLHEISGRDAAGDYLDGYLAEFNFIDGQALDASSFGETKSGVWIPKDTSGLTFGASGFRLEFKQNGTGTGSATTVGADTSGNTNHFNSTNVASEDVVLDSPNNNFATLNPLIAGASTYGLQTAPTPTNGNLSIAMAGGTNNIALSTLVLHAPNKYRCQFLLTARGSSTNWEIGICKPNDNINNGRIFFNSSGYIGNESGSQQGSLTSANTIGDKVEMLVDLNANNVKFAIMEAGTSTWVTLGTAESITSNTVDPIVYVREQGSSNISGTLDFGQSGYVGSDDNNYNPMSTLYLPEPPFSPLKDDIPEDYFDTLTWVGTQSSQSITGLQFTPDWVWLKNRDHTDWHNLMDTVRTNSSRMASNETNAEDDGSGIITSFDSNGFSVGSNSNSNRSGDNFIAWNWVAGGTPTATNSAGVGNAPTSGSVMIDGVASTTALAGTIAATKISANTESGFSIVAYTGNATAGATVAHGLGGTPEMMIVKRRGAVGNWFVFHHQANGVNSSDPETDYFVLEEANARQDNANPWNDTAPTSTVFTIGASGWTNSADTYIAYLFRSIQGFSKVGAYQGLNANNGPFVYTGFRPRFILGKRSNASVNWFIHDTTRDPINFTIHRLFPDIAGAENSSEAETTYGIDFLSNGFKIRAKHTSTGANDAYIYMAFAEMPFKYANAR